MTSVVCAVACGGGPAPARSEAPPPQPSAAPPSTAVAPTPVPAPPSLDPAPAPTATAPTVELPAVGTRVLIGGLYAFGEGTVASHECQGESVTAGTPCVVVTKKNGDRADIALGLVHVHQTTDYFMVADIFLCASKEKPTGTTDNPWQACVVKQQDGGTWCEALGTEVPPYIPCEKMHLVKPNATSRAAIEKALANE